MNLQKFKQTYVKVISESADERELKNYIRSIVEEVLEEASINEAKKSIAFRKTHPLLYAAVQKQVGDRWKGSPTTASLSDFDNVSTVDELKAKLDELETELEKNKDSKSKKLKAFLDKFYKPSEPIDWSKSKFKDPTIDQYGYPKNDPPGSKSGKSEMDDWL